jgi:hypothetical protein
MGGTTLCILVLMVSMIYHNINPCFQRAVLWREFRGKPRIFCNGECERTASVAVLCNLYMM